MGETSAELEARVVSWWTPAQAVEHLPAGWSYETKVHWIAENLGAGLVKAAAKAFRRPEDKQAVVRWVAIDPELWRHWAYLADQEAFWDTGNVTFYQAGTTGYGDERFLATFFGVRLDPGGFADVAPPEPPAKTTTRVVRLSDPPGGFRPSPSPAPPVNKGGRPRKDWWDDLWVEMCRQLYEGDLKPKRQADIEKAMHDWLAAHGETAAEETIRARARKLFSALQG